MSDLSAVLDANVLVPAPLRDTLLRAAEFGLYRPLWSDEILAEVERTLVRRGMVSDERAARLLMVLRTRFPEAYVRGFHRLIQSMKNDVGDRHVLAAAVRGRAHIIVTENVRDFPRLALQPYDVAAQTSDEFLCDLYAMNAPVMAQVIVEQAAALRRPPSTPESILSRLLGNAPTFVKQMHKEFFAPNAGPAVFPKTSETNWIHLYK